MGAQKSIHAGKAKIDVNVDFTHKICASLMLPQLRNTDLFSLVIGSLCIKHPNLFGRSEKLDVSWDKGLYDSNVLVAFRRPRPEWLPQQSFFIQHSVSPEIGVHGIAIDNFSRSGSGGVNLSRLSVGLDLNEPASSHWSSTTSVKLEHVRPLNDDGRSISRDLDGFPVTCSGNPHDSMLVLKQESRFVKANDRSFSRFSMQIEQGVPILSKWLIFNRFKFVASKGIKIGPGFLLAREALVSRKPAEAFLRFQRHTGRKQEITEITCRITSADLSDFGSIYGLTGGSIVGDMAPYQAFAVGGVGSVRGYGEGGVGSGRSCLVANSELKFPLNKMLEGVVFLDCGTDLGSGHLVPGNPALRQGKPGSGIGVGYGLRFRSPFGHFEVDYALNAFQQKTVYFGMSNIPS